MYKDFVNVTPESGGAGTTPIAVAADENEGAARITSPIMAIPAGAYVEKKLKKYFGDKASITQMDYFDDVVSSLAVIL